MFSLNKIYIYFKLLLNLISQSKHEFFLLFCFLRKKLWIVVWDLSLEIFYNKLFVWIEFKFVEI